jgi:hypothetical protein
LNKAVSISQVVKRALRLLVEALLEVELKAMREGQQRLP